MLGEMLGEMLDRLIGALFSRSSTTQGNRPNTACYTLLSKDGPRALFNGEYTRKSSGVGKVG